MFSLLFALSNAKQEFLNSEWDVYALENDEKKLYTAEIHRLNQSSNYFFSLWDDNENNNDFATSPDDAVLLQGNFSFSKNNAINFVGNYKKRTITFETKLVKGENDDHTLEIGIDSLTTLSIHLINETYFKGDLIQIGRGKVIKLVGISHFKYHTPFVLSNKFITVGSVILFVALQIRSTINNYRDQKEEVISEQRREIEEYLKNATFKKEEEQKPEEKKQKNEKSKKDKKKKAKMD